MLLKQNLYTLLEILVFPSCLHEKGGRVVTDSIQFDLYLCIFLIILSILLIYERHSLSVNAEVFQMFLNG